MCRARWFDVMVKTPTGVSSLRVRGTGSLRVVHGDFLRVIPACAGKRSLKRAQCRRSWICGRSPCVSSTSDHIVEHVAAPPGKMVGHAAVPEAVTHPDTRHPVVLSADVQSGLGRSACGAAASCCYVPFLGGAAERCRRSNRACSASSLVRGPQMSTRCMSVTEVARVLRATVFLVS